MDDKKSWVKVTGHFRESGSSMSYFHLGNVKLRNALGECNIYDVKIGNRVFESCHVKAYFPGDSYDETILAKTPDGVEIKINDGAYLSACQEAYGALMRAYKEKQRQEDMEFLLKIKKAIEQKLSKLQSSNFVDWNVSLSLYSTVKEILLSEPHKKA